MDVASYASLAVVVAGLVLSAGMWVVGAFSSNYTQSVNGKRGFLISAGAALGIGVAQTLIQYAYDNDGDWGPAFVVGGGLAVYLVLDRLVRLFRRANRLPRTAARTPGRGTLIAASVSVVAAGGWLLGGPVLAVSLLLPTLLAAVLCFRKADALGRRLGRHVLWIALRVGSVLLPRIERAEWISETWAYYLDAARPRRYRYLFGALVQLPRLVWTIRGVSRAAQRPSGAGRSRPKQVPITVRVVAAMLRQVCRPLDWVASSDVRSSVFTVSVAATAMTWVYFVGGWSRVWDDLEQQGVLLIVVTGAISSWRRLRGIKLKDDASPAE